MKSKILSNSLGHVSCPRLFFMRNQKLTYFSIFIGIYVIFIVYNEDNILKGGLYS